MGIGPAISQDAIVSGAWHMALHYNEYAIRLYMVAHNCSYFYFVHCQESVVSQGPYQMDRQATLAPILGALSLTPVTQGTG